MLRRPDYEACAALAERVLQRSGCVGASCVLGAATPHAAGTFFALTGAPAFFLFSYWDTAPSIKHMPAGALHPTSQGTRGTMRPT
jgi:hypothetical protein